MSCTHNGIFAMIYWQGFPRGDNFLFNRKSIHTITRETSHKSFHNSEINSEKHLNTEGLQVEVIVFSILNFVLQIIMGILNVKPALIHFHCLVMQLKAQNTTETVRPKGWR